MNDLIERANALPTLDHVPDQMRDLVALAKGLASDVGRLAKSRDELLAALGDSDCPSVIIDDPSVRACVDAGLCGCGNNLVIANAKETL